MTPAPMIATSAWSAITLPPSLRGVSCRRAEEFRLSEEPFPDFPRIYEAYHGKVLAYALKLLGPDEAEDVTQEVFVKIGRSLETLSDSSKLTSWIYAITLNAVRDAARKRSSRPDRAFGTRASTLGDEERDDRVSRIPDAGRLHRARAGLQDELRRNCRCYFNDRGELMGEPKSR